MADLEPILAAEQQTRFALATTLLHASFVEFFDRFQKILGDQHLGEVSETDALWKLRFLCAELTTANEKLRRSGGILPDELP